LFEHFGGDTTKQVMPGGKKLAEVARLLTSRTVEQTRLQVNNYINGK